MDITLLTGKYFILQAVLVVVLVAAAVLAKKKLLKQHCFVMRLAVVVQLFIIVRGMFPSLVSHLRAGLPPDWFFAEMVGHALVGLSIVSIWVFVNLAYTGVIKVRWRLVWPMRAAFGLWLLNFALGAHMYLFTQRL